jgi:SAM-dependent methyltransferase
MNILNIDFSKQDLLKLQEKDKYDFIFSIGTLIYFSKDRTKKILENLAMALKRGGYLYLDLPQENFLEVNLFPIQCYPTYYQALKDENSGDLYSFEDMQLLLQELGYTIVFTNKSFSYPGKFAWELDNLLREKKVLRMRYFFLYVLKLLARLDAITKHKKGCCFVLLAQKG